MKRAPIVLAIVAVLAACPLGQLVSCASESTTTPPGDSPCAVRYIWDTTYDYRCEGNSGCTELEELCGECACSLCWNEQCFQAICSDGLSERCPGSPWDSELPRSESER